MGRRDRGSATLEIAVLGPVLLLLVFTVVQAGLWAYARNLALAAAQEGATAGAAYGARAGDGVGRARAFVARAGGDSLTDVTVGTAGSTTALVRIEVRGRSLSVLPGVPGMVVTQHARATPERFRPDLP